MRNTVKNTIQKNHLLWSTILYQHKKKVLSFDLCKHCTIKHMYTCLNRPVIWVLRLKASGKKQTKKLAGFRCMEGGKDECSILCPFFRIHSLKPLKPVVSIILKVATHSLLVSSCLLIVCMLRLTASHCNVCMLFNWLPVLCMTLYSAYFGHCSQKDLVIQQKHVIWCVTIYKRYAHSLKGIVHYKINYLTSCLTKHVWLPFLCATQKMKKTNPSCFFS